MEEVQKILYAMGISEAEKTYLVAYHIKDVGQVWYRIWRDVRACKTSKMTQVK